MKKTWFITGSSRGLGRSLTEAVLATGDQVVATARNIADLKELTGIYGKQVLPLKLDVNVNEEITAAVASAIAHFGRIDVLVNNAGFGITGATEAYTEEQVNSQLMTNLYAPIALTRAVLPHAPTAFGPHPTDQFDRRPPREYGREHLPGGQIRPRRFY